MYLRQTQSPRVYENEFVLPELTHRFEVIRLWEQPPDQFLKFPGLLPFAVLSQTLEPERILRTVAQQANIIKDRNRIRFLFWFTTEFL